MLALEVRRRKERLLASSTEGVIQRGLDDRTSKASSYRGSLHRGLAGRI
jgi:hypothetical protein